ncbi:MAG: hypothetical protein ACRDZX_07225, partial [Acidimicrobiales bacterium]
PPPPRRVGGAHHSHRTPGPHPARGPAPNKPWHYQGQVQGVLDAKLVTWGRTLFDAGDVAAWPLAPGSAGYAADIVADYKADYGSAGVNSLPIYVVPATTLDTSISVSPGCANFRQDTGDHAPVPDYASLNGSSDNPLVVYQPSTGTDWEFWQAAKAVTGGYSACWGGQLKVKASGGIFPAPYGMSATGISYLATAITEADVASGSIHHALAIQLPRCDGFTYPADRGDCAEDAGQPPEGQWFRLPANLPVPPGLAPFARMVMRALQRYGAVVTDRAGAVMVVAEQSSDWSAEGGTGTDPITASWTGLSEYKVIAGLPWGDLQAVTPPHLSG